MRDTQKLGGGRFFFYSLYWYGEHVDVDVLFKIEGILPLPHPPFALLSSDN